MILEAILLGIIQGITEFIPVSSSGHLVLFHEVLTVGTQELLFDVGLHLGTLLALLLYFRKDIAQLVRGFFGGKPADVLLTKMLVIGTIPAVIAGLLLQDLAEAAFRSPVSVAAMLALFGVVMLLAERYAKTRKPVEIKAIGIREAVMIGVAQACAIVPGVSRSGATISAGLFAGLNRVAAARFSFLLAMPVILGASIKVLFTDSAYRTLLENPAMFSAGFLAAFVSGLVAIRFLLGFVARYSIASFAYYRFAVAAVVLLVVIF